MTSIFRSAEARQAVLDGQRSFFERWPDPTESWVPTRQGDTFLATCGPPNGEPIALLHGAGFNSSAWTADVAAWATTHQVVAVDVIGEPGRSAESRPQFETDAYALWLDDVLDALDIPNAAFVGASLGGWLAFDYAMRRPERVNRLAALVPAGIGRQRLVPLLALLFAPFGKPGRRGATDFVLGPRPELPQDPDLAELQHAMRDYLFLVQRSYRPRRNTLPVFSDDQIKRLAMPVLVITGAKDRLIDASDTARRLAVLLPDAKVDLRPHVGHIPTDYATAIHDFLREKRFL